MQTVSWLTFYVRTLRQHREKCRHAPRSQDCARQQPLIGIACQISQEYQQPFLPFIGIPLGIGFPDIPFPLPLLFAILLPRRLEFLRDFLLNGILLRQSDILTPSVNYRAGNAHLARHSRLPVDAIGCSTCRYHLRTCHLLFSSEEMSLVDHLGRRTIL